ncbi:alpha/beta hydrolase [Agrilactobacillus yilanensis]|uniref:Alpha/beta hydrolase n=1 Tax=Agrilactobacillus yilanensis TaxID=2485997 RepID=A0ABW4J655_9LACO|nr:alpha/beta hydrolase [Agrilactobacillus yilanensis]
MKTFQQALPLTQETADKTPAYLQGYLHEPNPETHQSTYPAIIIIPGGSYTHIPEHQAEQLALAFFAQGYQAFYLRYHFIDEGDPLMPAPLVDLAHAVTYLNKNHHALALDATKIVIAGFSVGGHIAALYGDYWASDFLDQVSQTTKATRQPAAIILGYPVIRLDAGFPKAKADALAITDNLDFYAADQHVSKTNPATFIWVTNDDQAVPVKNSLLYAAALNAANVAQELHIFDHGPHGLALANAQTAWRSGTDLPHVAKWFDLAQEWLFHTLTTETLD